MSPRRSHENPTLSGIYQIRCTRNGKIYVGSAVDLRWRWRSHRRDLSNGVHVNPHLQSAWNPYGETSFKFSVLEYVQEDKLLQREFIKTHDGFIDPNGKSVGPIRNLAAFCRKNGLENAHMTAVASGRIVSHRGWTHVRGRKRVAPVVHRGFIAPGGAVVRISNLSAFCRAAGLCKVHMFELKNGTRPSHKGWTWKYDADKAFDAFE